MNQMWPFTETAAVHSGARAFASAGLRPSDIDVAQVYDSFTITVLLTLESLGFCAQGEGGAFVESGSLAYQHRRRRPVVQPPRPARRVHGHRGRPPAARHLAGRAARRPEDVPRERYRRVALGHRDDDPGGVAMDKPRPIADALTQPYWDAAADGRLLVQRCEACERYQWYPRAHCVACGGARARLGGGEGHRPPAHVHGAAEDAEPGVRRPTCPTCSRSSSWTRACACRRTWSASTTTRSRCDMPLQVIFVDGLPCFTGDVT